jgi:hypothetical protein
MHILGKQRVTNESATKLKELWIAMVEPEARCPTRM